MKNLLLALLFGALTFIYSCADKDELLADNSSVTLVIEGTTYQKAENIVVNYIEFSVNDEDFVQINGTVINDEDSVEFSINVPGIQSASYSKTTTDDEDVNITVWLDETTSFSTNPFVTDPVVDVSTYELDITARSDQSLAGDFSSTLMNDNGTTIEVSGDFVAIDFLSGIFGGQ